MSSPPRDNLERAATKARSSSEDITAETLTGDGDGMAREVPEDS